MVKNGGREAALSERVARATGDGARHPDAEVPPEMERSSGRSRPRPPRRSSGRAGAAALGAATRLFEAAAVAAATPPGDDDDELESSTPSLGLSSAADASARRVMFFSKDERGVDQGARPEDFVDVSDVPRDGERLEDRRGPRADDRRSR
ncbi:hypothetical protein JL721_9543 [Aureococcus anophagefferens]|nr:hypothetical protein JL721_9543 [Aureococcus anophagefferens]